MEFIPVFVCDANGGSGIMAFKISEIVSFTEFILIVPAKIGNV
jgi:hypothetical protein